MFRVFGSKKSLPKGKISYLKTHYLVSEHDIRGEAGSSPASSNCSALYTLNKAELLSTKPIAADFSDGTLQTRKGCSVREAGQSGKDLERNRKGQNPGESGWDP